MPRQDVTVELFYNGVWNAAPVYSTRNPITINRDTGDGGEPPPGTLTLTLDDRLQRYNPKNPASPLYGLIGRNTPIRVSFPGDTRFYGEVAGWKPGRSVEFTPGGRGNAWCEIEAAGILRRLGQGADSLPSAMRRFVEAQPGVLSYFPCEDGSTALLPANVIPPALAATGAELTFGADDTFPASGGAMTFSSATSFFQSAIPTQAASGVIDVVVLFKLDALPSTAMELFRVTCTGDAALMTVTLDGLNIGRNVYQADGTPLVESGTSHAVDMTEWVALRFKLEQTAPGTITWSSRRFQVGSTSQFFGTGSFSGTLGWATGITIGPDAQKANAKFAHILVANQAFPFETGEFVVTVVGWSGYEDALLRLERLCGESGVPFTSDGATVADEDMGTQRANRFVALLAECQRTDDGLLFEPRDSLGLHYRTRASLYNGAPVLTLNWSAQQIAEPFQPVIDDLASRNDVTANQPGGTSARAVLETGSMSVLAQPDGIGRYATTVDVNQHDQHRTLPLIASWYMRKGTLDELRYPQVTVEDLADQPGLITAAAAVDIGDVIVITNLPAGVTPDDARLIVTGYTEVIESHARRITFNCAPARAYEVGVWTQTAGPTSTRWDSAHTIRPGVTPISSTQTSITLDTPVGQLWTMNPAHFPFDVNVVGERMRVTAIAPDIGTRQAFTVTRSVNGVVKDHPAGVSVRLWKPARWAL